MCHFDFFGLVWRVSDELERFVPGANFTSLLGCESSDDSDATEPSSVSVCPICLASCATVRCNPFRVLLTDLFGNLCDSPFPFSLFPVLLSLAPGLWPRFARLLEVLFLGGRQGVVLRFGVVAIFGFIAVLVLTSTDLDLRDIHVSWVPFRL